MDFYPCMKAFKNTLQILFSVQSLNICGILFLLFCGLGWVRIHAQPLLTVRSIQSDGLAFDWNGEMAASMGLRYGLTPELELGTVSGLELHGLAAANYYFVQAIGGEFADAAPIQLFTTASSSAGEIRVYFNQSVDQNASSLANAVHIPNMEDTLVAYISAAQNTLDVCNYNTGSQAIVDAVNAAAGRGVVVRYIAADNTGTNNSRLGNLSSSIPLLQRPNDGEVMHNKFMVIDRADALGAKVVTGSVNHTPNSCSDDYNNLVIVFDQALANAYTTEFEEMWGGTGALPNPGNAKFGAAKTDNTPHNFMIGGRMVELYFSPSDGTTAKIEAALQSADHDMQFAMLTFIHNDLGDVVKNRHQNGVDVKGIIENIYYFGSEYTGLLSAGVDVQSHFSLPNFLHHKYGIVDAQLPSSDPLVITGSHNWTNSAEEDYDENTLIIHDAEIANMFFEEFAMRYAEATGTAISEAQFSEIRVAIDPRGEWLRVEANAAIRQLEIRNLWGQSLAVYQPNAMAFGCELGSLPAGAYLLTIRTEQGQYSRKWIKL